MDLGIHGPVSLDLFGGDSSLSNHCSIIDVTIVDKWNTWRQDIRKDTFLNFKLTEETLSAAELLIRAVDSIKAKLLDGHSIVIAFSGGKDSNLLLHAFNIACMELKREGLLHVIQPCGLLHSDTLIENPEAHNLAMDYIQEVVQFASNEQIPLTPIIASPTLQSSWFGKVLAGRGIPIFVNAKSRDCAVDWKIQAGKIAVNKWIKSLAVSNPAKFRKSNLLTLIGSRIGESVKRDISLSVLGSDDQKIIRNKDGEGFLYPIMNFDVDRLWAVLTKSGQQAIIPAAVKNFDDLFEFYSEGSGGDCQLVAAPVAEDFNDSDGKELINTSSGACSSRSGCILCTAVSEDKSVIQMIDNNQEKFGYLTHLNRVQQALANSQYNWNLRGGVGRTLYENGYLELKHDTYSNSFLVRILHGLISADYLEEIRAKNHKRKFDAGLLPESSRNYRMCKPQFKFITQEVVVYLDFIWSLHGYASEIFCATQTWNAVYQHGELELFDDVEELKRSPTKRISNRYLQVTPKGEFWDQGRFVVNDNFRPKDIGLSTDSPTQDIREDDDDFSDYEDIDAYYMAIDSGLLVEETVCSNITTPVFDPHSGQELNVLGTVTDGNQLKLNIEHYELFATALIKDYISNPNTTPLEACKCLLRIGLVELPKGQLLNRHYQALRGQTLYFNGLTSDNSVEQILKKATNGYLNVKSSSELEMHSSKGTINVKPKRRKTVSDIGFNPNEQIDENQLSLL
ncbi:MULTISPECIES: hypothetical protein [Vibrio]|uniref:hypothetical protein n=1 Tax=Vibrio TaxID=662 RepID=UPI001E41933A|nr:hypothetical protein [Vibrio lentus]MCC4838020.1 hypothetical protein [Vibrio lentus]